MDCLNPFQWFAGQGQTLGWETAGAAEEQEGEAVRGAEGMGEEAEEGVGAQHHEVTDQGVRDAAQILGDRPR